MNFEGGKYERVLIMIVAYIIGLITGYIMFGMNTNDDFESKLAMFDGLDLPTIEESTDAKGIDLVEDESGLYYINGNKKRLLSLNQASLSDLVDYVTLVNGLYYQIIGASLSPNERFVFYCEQLSASEDLCEPFVYDSETDIVHRVALANDEKSISIENITVDWQPDSRLQVNEFVSSSAEEPWL